MTDRKATESAARIRSLLSRREAFRFGALGGAGLVLAACSSDPSSSPGPTTSNPSTAGDTSGPAPSTPSPKPAPTGTTKLTLAAPRDPSGATQTLIDAFNDSQQSISVEYQELPQTSNDVYNQYVAALAAGAKSPDILTLDVIWPTQFAAAGWVEPLDKYLESGAASKYFAGAIDAATVDGKVYGLPQYVDSGFLFYRKDLLTEAGIDVPETMDQLLDAAKTLGKDDVNGFMFAGAQIEAIVDEWFEWLWGMGATGYDASRLVADSAESKAALQYMYDLIYKYEVSPKSTSTLKPNDIRVVMQNGRAALMRNWTFAWGLLQDEKESKVAGKIGVAAVPGQSAAGNGCLGGWIYSINVNSGNKDASWEFINFATQSAQQAKFSITSGGLPGRIDAYDDPSLQKANPEIGSFRDALKGVKARPGFKDYTSQSSLVQAEWNACLSGQKSVEAAVAAAAAALKNMS